MSLRTRKILVVLMMGAFVAFVGLALWFLFFRTAPPALPPETEGPGVQPPGPGLEPSRPGEPGTAVPPAPGELPAGVSPIADGGLTAVALATADRAAGASLGAAGQVSYYSLNDGRFYRIGADGEPVSLSGRQFYNVSQATFDPNGTKAIIEYPNGSKIFYDFSRDRQVTLPDHWEEFSWSADGEKIAAKSLGLDVSNRYLVISNPDGSNARPIQELGDNASKVTVAWSPSNQVVAISETGQAYGVDSREIFMIGQNRENFKTITVEGLNFDPLWTPDGSRLLYSVSASTDGYRPALWVVDAIGDSIGNNRRSLGIQTWADKCAFADAQTLYCGVPDRLEKGWGIQPGLAAGVTDTIYRIDINTGARTRIAVPYGSYSVESLMVTEDGRWLYFTDQATGLLNRIQLK